MPSRMCTNLVIIYTTFITTTGLPTLVIVTKSCRHHGVQVSHMYHNHGNGDSWRCYGDHFGLLRTCLLRCERRCVLPPRTARPHWLIACRDYIRFLANQPLRADCLARPLRNGGSYHLLLRRSAFCSANHIRCIMNQQKMVASSVTSHTGGLRVVVTIVVLPLSGTFSSSLFWPLLSSLFPV